MSQQLFEIATRNKWRFDSPRGSLIVQDLWDLKLQSRDGLDLNTVAKSVNAELKALGEENFVQSANPRENELRQKLELVKYIIGVKQAEIDAAEQKQARASKLERLTALMAAKDEEELKSMTKEQLQAQIDALNA